MRGRRPRMLLVAALGLAAGLLVELLRDSPADRGGLEPGDVVVEVDGRGVEDAAQLRNELARAQVGAQLRVTVLREGRRRVLRVSVEEAGAGA